VDGGRIEAEPLLVDAIGVLEALVAADEGDQRRDVVRHHAHALLAPAQRALGRGDALQGALGHQHGSNHERDPGGEKEMNQNVARPQVGAGDVIARGAEQLHPGDQEHGERPGDDPEGRSKGEEARAGPAEEAHASRHYLATRPRGM
jgi:hypothetical protein